ncbi:hypothetical protein BH11ACT6_BH11ACT6_01740 [soil metagenome]
MTTRTDTARNISQWSNLGIELPKQLADKIAVFDAVSWVETGHQVVVDTSKITVKNAENAVADLALRLLPAQVDPSTRRSALEQARLTIQDQLALEILREATKAVPEVVEQLRPIFDDAVAQYVGAVAELPGELNYESLFGAGPSAQASYGSALAAVKTIREIDVWLTGLTSLPEFWNLGLEGEPLFLFRVLSPATRGEVNELWDARRRAQTNTADAVEIDLDPMFLYAARNGIEWGINTPAESVAIRERIEETAVVSPVKHIRL